MALDTNIIVINPCTVAELENLGIAMRSSVTTVGDALALRVDDAEDDETEGWDVPAVVAAGDAVVIIEPSEKIAIDLSMFVAANLGREVDAAIFSVSGEWYAWHVLGPAGVERAMVREAGKTSQTVGAPTVEEAAVTDLNESSLLALAVARAGSGLDRQATVRVIDLDSLDMLLDPEANAWRKEATPAGLADLKNLRERALGMGQDMVEGNLDEQGFAFPIIVALKEDGTFDYIPRDAALPSPDDMLDGLWSYLDSVKDNYRAVAALSETPQWDDSPAICAQFEHRQGGAFITILPFSQYSQGSDIEYGDAEDISFAPRVWV